MPLAARHITRPIRSDREYASSIREIERLLELDPRPGTSDDDRLDLLSVLVEAYESERGYDLPDASPQELVDFMLDQTGCREAGTGCTKECCRRLCKEKSDATQCEEVKA
jgi:antitoxin component HigA of HigAB toxin-antitoxin module